MTNVRRIVLLFVCAAALAGASPKPNIAITQPASGAVVPHRVTVRGTVADPGAKVWVIVRPMLWSDYHVEPPVDVNSDGTWSVTIYIGEGEDMNSGEAFKIAAVANPKARLQEKQKLQGWPEAKWRSDIIEVYKDHLPRR